MIVYGINPVLEVLRAGRVTALRVGQRSGGRIQELLALAAERGVRTDRVDTALLDRLSRGGVHQGVVAEVEDASIDYSVADLVRNRARSTS